MTTVLTTVGLSKGFDQQRPVLSGAELTAVGGRITLIRGRPGSGRTTLARCLTGVYRPDGGDVILRLGGERMSVTASDARTVAWLRAHHLAAFDGPPAAAPNTTVQTVVAHEAGCTPAAAAAGLERLGVAHLAHMPLGRLRAVQRHTVALAAALLSARPFVVLDGPDRYAPTQVLCTWLHEVATAGAALVVMAAADSPLEPIASVVGELEQGEITWHTR